MTKFLFLSLCLTATLGLAACADSNQTAANGTGPNATGGASAYSSDISGGPGSSAGASVPGSGLGNGAGISGGGTAGGR